MLSATFFVPHPPVVIPGIGNQDNLQKVIGTRSALKKLGARVENINPDTLIFLTPHAPVDSNSMSVNKETDLEGDFMDFGFLGWGKSKKNNLDLVNKIKAKFNKEDIPLTEFKARLDHGVLVPLFYLSSKNNYKLVHLTYSLKNAQYHFDLGKIIAPVFKEYKKKIILVASGDLSHRISYDAPAGYSPLGKEFDEKIRLLLREGKWSQIINLPEDLIDEAGECGMRSLAFALGVLSDYSKSFHELSYESPFGVGYLTGEFIFK